MQKHFSSDFRQIARKVSVRLPSNIKRAQLQSRELKALGLLWTFEESKSAVLCFHDIAMIRTCTHPHSKNNSQKDDAVKSNRKCFYQEIHFS